MSHRHSIFCIIPPYMLDQIADQGTTEQRRTAVRTLAASYQVREKRQNMAALTPARSAFKGRSLVPAVKQRAVYTAKFGTNLPGTLLRGEGTTLSQMLP